MKTFLEEVAEQIVRTHPRLDEVTVVFPNRRAALYFRKHLGGLIKRPVFSPRVLTIEDFIGGFSSLKSAEKITLISVLYQAYRKVMHTDDDSDTVDTLERFYFSSASTMSVSSGFIPLAISAFNTCAIIFAWPTGCEAP